MPKATLRLSAGRIRLSFEQQALCFLAGANSLWMGEKLLTVCNSDVADDEEMLSLFGLKKRPAYAHQRT
jgi:biotin synthase